MRLLLGPAAPDVPAEGAELTLSDLERLYAHESQGRPTGPFVRANMVSGLDGTISADGVSAGLSSPADKDVFAVLRAWADVVLVGAGTVRDEQYRPARIRTPLQAGRAARGQGAAPRIAVVSGSLDLDLESQLMKDNSTVIVTSAHADASRIAELQKGHDVIVSEAGAVDLRHVLLELHRRGLSRILCEGGPSLLGSLVADGLVDDLCLSLAPSLGGGMPAGLLGTATVPQQQVRLLHVIQADGFLMTRYALNPQDGGIA